MPTWLIIVLVVLVVLAVGGYVARSMLTRRTEAQFRARLEQANHDQAEAADRPGTDEDYAVFHVQGDGRRETLTLGRRDGDWMLQNLA